MPDDSKEKVMLEAKAGALGDLVELEELMDRIFVSDRHLELAAETGGLGDFALSGSSNPGVNCTGGCN